MMRLKRLFFVVVGLFAIAFLLELLVGFFGVPRGISRWLACSNETNTVPPRLCVVMGGGGIPSESGLIRCYYAAELRRHHPALQYIVSLPSEGDPTTNSVGRMRDELVLRGVPAKSVRMEYAALNTHEQAVNVAKLIGPAGMTSEVCVVTGSLHLRRSLGCFRKAGFTHVHGTGAVSIGAEADAGSGTMLRYVFWANLIAGVDVLRECCAVGVYKLRGWM